MINTAGMGTINAVNIIVYRRDTVDQIISFPDNNIGNREAEAVFLMIGKAHGMPECEQEEALDNGYWEKDGTDYQIFLAHSV